jgi:hypothetical protein
MFYNFVFGKFNTNIKNIDHDINLNHDDNIDLKYHSMFKKLVKISKNPIIFEYQLEQIEKLKHNLNKYNQYNQYKKDFKDICDINNKKFIYSRKYYQYLKKILIKKKYNHKNINNILIKLLCINFL